MRHRITKDDKPDNEKNEQGENTVINDAQPLSAVISSLRYLNDIVQSEYKQAFLLDEKKATQIKKILDEYALSNQEHGSNLVLEYAAYLLSTHIKTGDFKRNVHHGLKILNICLQNTAITKESSQFITCILYLFPIPEIKDLLKMFYLPRERNAASNQRFIEAFSTQYAAELAKKYDPYEALMLLKTIMRKPNDLAKKALTQIELHLLNFVKKQALAQDPEALLKYARFIANDENTPVNELIHQIKSAADHKQPHPVARWIYFQYLRKEKSLELVKYIDKTVPPNMPDIKDHVMVLQGPALIRQLILKVPYTSLNKNTISTTEAKDIKQTPTAEAVAALSKAQPAEAATALSKAQPAEAATALSKVQSAEAAATLSKVQSAEAAATLSKAQPAEAAATLSKAQPAEAAVALSKVQPTDTAHKLESNNNQEKKSDVKLDTKHVAPALKKEDSDHHIKQDQTSLSWISSQTASELKSDEPLTAVSAFIVCFDIPLAELKQNLNDFILCIDAHKSTPKAVTLFKNNLLRLDPEFSSPNVLNTMLENITEAKQNEIFEKVKLYFQVLEQAKEKKWITDAEFNLILTTPHNGLTPLQQLAKPKCFDAHDFILQKVFARELQTPGQRLFFRRRWADIDEETETDEKLAKTALSPIKK